MKDKNDNSDKVVFPPTQSSIMTLRQVANYLGFHYLTIYRLIQEGKIPAAKVGGSWRFKKDVIDRWIEQDMDSHYRRKRKQRKGEGPIVMPPFLDKAEGF